MSNQNPLGGAKAPQRRYWQTADFWMDAGERIVSSFLFAFVGAITLVGFDVTDGRAWGGAAIAAGLSTVKAIVGAQRPDSTTPVSIF
jgi:hypothetical protein